MVMDCGPLHTDTDAGRYSGKCKKGTDTHTHTHSHKRTVITIDFSAYCCCFCSDDWWLLCEREGEMSDMSGWLVKYTHRWYRLFLVCRFVLLVLGSLSARRQLLPIPFWFLNFCSRCCVRSFFFLL